MRKSRSADRHGFSLIELVIVVVIIAIIGAIAVPRLSRGSTGASEAALAADLTVIRNAIELYAIEHLSEYPTSPLQLVKRTDEDGNVDDGTGEAGGFIYGPYLRKAPPLPVGEKRGSAEMEVVSSPTAEPPGTTNRGWWYNSSNGVIRANLPATAKDSRGRPFNEF